MEHEKIYTPDAPANPPTISHAVRYGKLLFVSGQVGRRPDGTIPETVEEQVQVAFENLKAILAAAGTDLSHVLRCQCYLSRPEDFAVMNRTYHPYFEGMAVPPARCTVFAGLANPKLLFEITVTAGL